MPEITSPAQVEEPGGALRPLTADDLRGPQGDPGMPGANGADGAGDAYYRHQQIAPATVWIVNHGLGKEPALEVRDSAGDIHDPDFVHNSLNTLTITLTSASGGEAICN